MDEEIRDDYHGPIEHSIEIAVERLEKILKITYTISVRTIALLLLQEDQEIKEMIREKQPDTITDIEKIIEEIKSYYGHPKILINSAADWKKPVCN